MKSPVNLFQLNFINRNFLGLMALVSSLALFMAVGGFVHAQEEGVSSAKGKSATRKVLFEYGGAQVEVSVSSSQASEEAFLVRADLPSYHHTFGEAYISEESRAFAVVQEPLRLFYIPDQFVRHQDWLREFLGEDTFLNYYNILKYYEDQKLFDKRAELTSFFELFDDPVAQELFTTDMVAVAEEARRLINKHEKKYRDSRIPLWDTLRYPRRGKREEKRQHEYEIIKGKIRANYLAVIKKYLNLDDPTDPQLRLQNGGFHKLTSYYELLERWKERMQKMLGVVKSQVQDSPLTRERVAFNVLVKGLTEALTLAYKKKAEVVDVPLLDLIENGKHLPIRMGILAVLLAHQRAETEVEGAEPKLHIRLAPENLKAMTRKKHPPEGRRVEELLKGIKFELSFLAGNSDYTTWYDSVQTYSGKEARQEFEKYVKDPNRGLRNLRTDNLPGFFGKCTDVLKHGNDWQYYKENSPVIKLLKWPIDRILGR